MTRSAEYALDAYLCRECRTCLTPQEVGHTMCRKCAEKDMAQRLGEGVLVLPADWYDDTPDREAFDHLMSVNNDRS